MRFVVIVGVIMSVFFRASNARKLGLLSLSSLLTVKGSLRPSSCAASSTVVDIASNPLADKSGLPKFAEIAPEHVLPAVERDLAELKENFEELESVFANPQKSESWGKRRIEYDYSGVVESMEKVGRPLDYSWGVVGHMMGVKNSEALREAHNKMQGEVIKTRQAMGQSKPLFQALSALKKRQSVWSELDGPQKRIVDSFIRSMENSGVGLEGEKKETFNKLQLEAADLSTKFSNNVLDSTKEFSLKITDKADVEGLPPSALAGFAAKSVSDGDEGATAEAGPWTITMDMPSYLACMKNLKSRDIREKLYRAFITRASEGEKDNAPLIKRILQIKKEMSAILGYANHAEKSLASKMASSVEEVNELTETLLKKALPAAQAELEELKTFAKEQGFSGELALWDAPYWGERLREAKYEYSEEELKPYFALPAVLDGMFSLCNRLFGVTIKAADGEASVWNKDVRFFKIFDDETGEHIASFYLDPYSRPEDKRGGAWMDSERGRSKVLNNKPVAYLTCNGSPPVGDTPSLMTFREVETLFHETGHGLQHMLTEVVHGDAAGINNVEWDAVELPSQFMENWCYDKPTLYSFAKHWETGEPLPQDLFDKVRASKNFQAGMVMIRQLYFGSMDMHLHSVFNPYGEESVFDVQAKFAEKYTVLKPLPEDRFLCSFGHIFAGGYSAGYYSYKYAEVMSADAFSAFEDIGLANEDAVRETGRRFRKTVLAMGGGTHPAEVFKAFRGRAPSPEALLRHSGLSE